MNPSGRDEFPISSRLRGDNHCGDDDVDVSDGNDDEDDYHHSHHSLFDQFSTAWWS